MRVLTFPSIKSFEMTYEGLLTTTTKGPETRTLSKILHKMEKIGTKRVVDGKELPLYTCAEVPVIKFEESEYEFIKKKLNEVEWSGLGAREAGPLLDWLEEKQPTEEEYQAQKDGVLKLEKGEK